MRYWPISLVYFLFFAELGTFLTFWPLYLSSINYGPIEIGELMGLYMTAKIVGPNFWAWIADRAKRPVLVMRLGAILTLLTLGALRWVDDFWEMAAFMIVYSFCWNAVLPQLEAILLHQLKEQTHRYSLIRSWGSLGFGVLVVVVGWILDWKGAGSITGILFITLVAFLLASCFLSEVEQSTAKSSRTLLGAMMKYFRSAQPTQALPAQPMPEPSNNREGLIDLLKKSRGEVFAIFLICFLMIFSHGPYYTFYAIYMESFGFTSVVIGWLIAIGVISEIVLFFVIPRWAGRVTAYQLLSVSLFFAAIRWLLIGQFPDNLFVAILLQTFHAATFGAFHIAIVLMIADVFGKEHRGSGQAFYSSIGFGLGGALGAYLSGIAWNVLLPTNTFWLASVMALLGWLIAERFIKRERLAEIRL